MRRNPPARWVLPVTVDPASRRCIEIQVPDDPAHIAAFRGALLALASAYNWADDPTHKAKDVALVWRGIIDGMTEWGCTLQTKVRVDDICTLSWSYDDWTTFDSYDPSACISANIDSFVPDMIAQGILDAIQDGIIQGGTGQQSPQEPPVVGECKTYHVRLDAKNRWLCPSPVQAGDTIQITAASGGYWDGGASLVWSCPNGQYYGLGACYGSWDGQSSDPIPTAKHMQLIGMYGSNVYFDPLADVFVMPDGEDLQNFVIHANDSNLTDNQGEVEFDVEVCTGLWCYKFDFTTSNGGFTAADGTVMQWVNGYGWHTIWAGGAAQDGVYIYRDTPSDAQITYAELTLSKALTGASPEAAIGNRAYTKKIFDIHASQTVYEATHSETMTGLYIVADPYDGGKQAWDGYVVSLELHGTGSNPFGESNC